MLFISFLLGYTQENKNQLLPRAFNGVVKKQKLKEEELKSWHYKDIIEDTIPGISLDKAYDKILRGKKGDTVIVAVIDTEVDIYHEDLKKQFWINTKEVPNNGQDDDHNGYIDDIHGWNFLGNQKGENIIYTSYESVRLIKKFKPIFENKTIDTSLVSQQENYKIYQEAKRRLKENIESKQQQLKTIQKYQQDIKDAINGLKHYFATGSITKENLLEFKTEDTIAEKQAKKIIDYINRGITEESLLGFIEQNNGALELSANLDYQERKITGDNPNEIKDIAYGNNNVSGNLDKLYHGTIVTGVIAAKRDNNKGIDGVINEVKIMTLCVSANGDELDKDIALAIRYAVDNGAKIINMSSGKLLSMNRHWVSEAIKYAAKKDVLFITSAGNNALLLDEKENNYYPNDNDSNEKEISNNFMMVGANSYTLDKKLRYYLTNYGKNNVDLFAPGYKVYTTLPNNKYRYSQGTSIATPIVSGVAALLMSHYPDLKASQIKEILMKSGVSYNIDVEMFQKDDSKKMIPFSELSKSGKVVNAYNALVLAEQISKSKK